MDRSRRPRHDLQALAPAPLSAPPSTSSEPVVGLEIVWMSGRHVQSQAAGPIFTWRDPGLLAQGSRVRRGASCIPAQVIIGWHVQGSEARAACVGPAELRIRSSSEAYSRGAANPDLVSDRGEVIIVHSPFNPVHNMEYCKARGNANRKHVHIITYSRFSFPHGLMGPCATRGKDLGPDGRYSGFGKAHVGSNEYRCPAFLASRCSSRIVRVICPTRRPTHLWRAIESKPKRKTPKKNLTGVGFEPTLLSKLQSFQIFSGKRYFLSAAP